MPIKTKLNLAAPLFPGLGKGIAAHLSCLRFKVFTPGKVAFTGVVYTSGKMPPPLQSKE